MRQNGGIAILIIACCLSASAQKKIDLGSLPSCDPSQDKDWNTVQTALSGVEAGDPYTSQVDQYAAGRFGYAGLYLFPYNWLPLSSTKQQMCGRLERFDWNPLLNEQDWNLRVIPAPLFTGMFADATQYASDMAEVWSCDPAPNHDIDRHQCGVNSGKKYQEASHNCLEAELTPRRDMFITPWFRRYTIPPDQEACSAIVDYNLCVYGPFVTEAVHGNRPEIHPLEAIWWRNSQNAPLGAPESQDWTLLHAQDASQRYDERSDYFPRPGEQELDWAPWAESPRVVDFRIGLEVPANPASPVQMNADEYFASGVVPGEPGSSEQSYVAIYGGNNVLKLQVAAESANHFQVRMTGLCTTPASNVRMYLSIRSTIGTANEPGHHGELGFQAIHLWNAKSTNPALAMAPAGAKLQHLVMRPDSIHAVSRGKKVEFMGFASTLPQIETWDTEKAQRTQGGEVSINSILPKGEAVGVFPRVLTIRRKEKTGSDRGAASRLMSGFLGVQTAPENLGESISDTVVTAAPQLAVVRNGQPLWEEGADVLEHFNTKLAESGSSGFHELLDAQAPQPRWTFQGWTCGEHPEKGCTRRTEVGVALGKPPSSPDNFIHVDQDLDGDIPRFHVYFPTDGIYADTLLLLQITGTLQDPTTGESRTTKLEFYNIAVPVKNDGDAETERVVAMIAALIGVSGQKLSGGTPPNGSAPFAQGARFRQAEMLRLSIKHAAQDELIEPTTMAVLLDAGRRLASQP